MEILFVKLEGKLYEFSGCRFLDQSLYLCRLVLVESNLFQEDEALVGQDQVAGSPYQFPFQPQGRAWVFFNNELFRSWLMVTHFSNYTTKV